MLINWVLIKVNSMVNSIKMFFVVYCGLKVRCKIISSIVMLKFLIVIMLLSRFSICSGVVVR